jgi:hypothetical protein
LGGANSKIVGTFFRLAGQSPSKFSENFSENFFAQWFAALHLACGFHFLAVVFFSKNTRTGGSPPYVVYLPNGSSAPLRDTLNPIFVAKLIFQ